MFEGTLTYEPKLVICRRDGYVPEKFDFISSSISPGPSGLGSPETTLINLALYGSLEVLDTLKFIFSPGVREKRSAYPAVSYTHLRAHET